MFITQLLWSWMGTRRLESSTANTGAPSVSTQAPTPFASAPPAREILSARSPSTQHVEKKKPDTLLLIDTTPGVNFHDGTARLGLDVHNPQTYVAGALLVNGARLTEIHSDYVVLERGAETARLYAQGKQPAESPSSSSLLQMTTAPPQPPTEIAVPVSGVQAGASMTITDFIRPNPVFDHDQLQGFQLYPGRQSAAFFRLGLASGDVLTGINGVSVADAPQVMDALEQVLAGAALEITVERGGHRQEVTLDGATIVPQDGLPRALP